MFYLSEDIVGLALFDSDVDYILKNGMVRAMSGIEDNELPPIRQYV